MSLSIVNAPALAASVTAASFTDGGVVRDGVRYAKTGDQMKLSVTTDSTTSCVELIGAHTALSKGAHGQTSWSFTMTANDGNGVQTVTAIAYQNLNPQGTCVAKKEESAAIKSASYTLDNDTTGPVVTSTLTPAPNGAGWHKGDVSITWSATDESGVKSIVPASDTVTANTTTDGVEKTTVATDNVGNTTTGKVTVKVDKDAPVVVGTQSPAPNSAGWNNTDVTASFTTTDALSGVAVQAVGTVFGEGADQFVTGTGTDVAGNSVNATVGGVNVDKTPPTLSGAPTTQPNASGWYNDDVTVAWTAGDALAGLAAATPSNSTITGEGEGLTATETVTDKAGNSTVASSPAVNIDRTAPTTDANAPAGWNATDQTITLDPSDGGSGVASTRYTLDGGGEQTGTTVQVTGDGIHTLRYWSVDKAGNVEDTKMVTVKVDKTAPLITSSQNPEANGAGWNRTNVTVSFLCEDTDGSGIKSCTTDQVVSVEGAATEIVGAATDYAGNSTETTHIVNLDKTAPTVTGTRTPEANTHGWNKSDVTVEFSTNDTLSGVTSYAVGAQLGEGANQSVTGTGTDAAGNSTSTTVSGVNVDTTAPSLTGTPSTAGWSRGDVTVTWTASDALSGLDGAVPADSIVTGEGDNLSASASVTDKAGNLTAHTVAGMKIDRTEPSTTASVPAPGETGWYGQSVEVTLNATDNLSGVDTTYYTVGGGSAQEYSGPFTHSVKGVSTISYWSVDVAGNTGDADSLELKVDATAPTTEISLPAPFPTGWFADSVPVAFQVTDTESGVAKTYYTVDGGPATEWQGEFLHTLGGVHTLAFWSVDVAGNVETAQSQEIKVDTSAPTISGSRSPQANTLGWNNTDVTVSFRCEDSQSGVAPTNCTAPVLVGTEGVGQTVSGMATDNVGKTASTTVGDINIDKSAPLVTLVGGPAAGGSYYFGDVPAAPTCDASDALSGLAGTCQVTGGGTTVGAHTYTATVADKAGNTSTASVSYTVGAWTPKGFHQPIGIDNSIYTMPGAAAPSPTTATVWQAAKGGSVIPLKFNAYAGTVEKKATTDVKGFTATKLGSCSGSATETVEEVLTSGSTSLRYDTTDGQFVQNWKTGSVSGDTCYRVTVTLLDGTGIHTFVKLRK